MRLSAIILATILTGPAFAQEARAPQAPPPEGFYRNIDGAYDLLFRPYVYSDIQLARAPRLDQLLAQQSQPDARPSIDWTKPVIGVDAPLPIAEGREAVVVEVLETNSVEASSSAVREFIDSLGIPLPPPCEPPPVANAPAPSRPPPSPCPPPH
jgi:hypothetical protein